MKKNLIIYLTVIGLIGLFAGCEKDGSNVVMSTNPIAPTIKTMPNLILERANGTQTLTFVGTPVDPGFKASVNYYLEACASGDNFTNPISIVTSIQAEAIKITVSDLNGILLRTFPADQISTVDFRIRAQLVADAGTGVEPFNYNSATETAEVTLYGLPRLDLIGSGVDQKLESTLGDGVYTGYVKLDLTKSFTLHDPDADITYGDGGAGAIAVDGPGIVAATNGYSFVTVDTKALTIKMTQYEIGLVGDATPNAWNSPDTKMDYNSKNGTWYITTDLVAGQFKFRFNDGWAWNLGWNPGKTSLVHNGDNIDLPAGPGNYTLTLTITQFTAPETGTFTWVKN
jgi:hypothetical protein